MSARGSLRAERVGTISVEVIRFKQALESCFVHNNGRQPSKRCLLSASHSLDADGRQSITACA